MATPKEHIQEIRKRKFSIGEEPNPLINDVHYAIKHLSTDLYTRDAHFLRELIQNAEDNEYLPAVEPSLEFVITGEDITGTGAPATLLVFNNEKGFTKRDVESICSVGQSTKKGKRHGGFIGEKGIGFKSVFLVTSQPYIFSNRYQIRFSDEPVRDCGIGYIVPEWVDVKPTICDVHRIYGSCKRLPTTAIVLPIRTEKVEAVMEQLSSMHPEVLLFLSKVKQLSVCESNGNPSCTLTAISISTKTYFTCKQGDVDIWKVDLSAREASNKIGERCAYYMSRQRFAVKSENCVEERKEVEEWVISLAFPNGNRLKRGASSAGIYAFLPTQMVTNFPFIIQSDFILSSSRETILLDSKWNRGILDSVPFAFIKALVCFVQTLPVGSLTSIFKFFPHSPSSFAELNGVRESIRTYIQTKNIMPYESFSEKRLFCSPAYVGRLLPAFREVLAQLKKQGVPFRRISCEGKFVPHSDLDCAKLSEVLEFLGVKFVVSDWYGKCIQEWNLILQASEDVYMNLLFFIADNWSWIFCKSTVKDIDLLKYVDRYKKVALCSVYSAEQQTCKLCYARDVQHHAWLNKWNVEIGCIEDLFFFPHATRIALERFQESDFLRSWLHDFARVETLSIYDFARHLVNTERMKHDANLVITFVHFLCHSLSKAFLTECEVLEICQSTPVADSHGNVHVRRSGTLVPASGSKWKKLMGTNPWNYLNYIELAEGYALCGEFAGQYAQEKDLQNFLTRYINAEDLPELCPPDDELPAGNSQLTKEQAFMLLDWMQNLRTKGVVTSNRFMEGIKSGKWLKTLTGYDSPNRCFLLNGEDESSLAQLGDAWFSIIDKQFYKNKINLYEEELKILRVGFGYDDACQIIRNDLMLLANSSRLTRDDVVSLLKFIRFTKDRCPCTDEFLKTMKEGRWLKTSSGYRSPEECLLYDLKWKNVLEPGDAPFIDEKFYGTSISMYGNELKALGVVVDVESGGSIIAANLESHTQLSNIERIYRYLKRFKWKPQLRQKFDRWIYIPKNGSNDGKWVDAQVCVLFDKYKFFSSRLFVLEEYYEKSLLPVFSSVFGVPHEPSHEQYLKLWKDWEEKSGSYVFSSDCGSFWEHVVKIRNAKTKKTFTNSIIKVPTKSVCGGYLTRLVDKRGVFIPDDPHLEKIFTEAYKEPLFVWYPRQSSASIPLSRLNEIYKDLGVKKISESVQEYKEALLLDPDFQVDLANWLIGKGLLLLVLGFLGDPRVKMPVKKRHNTAKSLIDLAVYETEEPITVSYRLVLLDKTLSAMERRTMVYWEKDSHRLFVHNLNTPDHSTRTAFATDFSKMMSRVLLGKTTHLIDDLCALIRLGCLLRFEVDEVERLLQIGNLELSFEDEEFLSTAFPSEQILSPV